MKQDEFRIQMQVNGPAERIVMEYVRFYRQAPAASGSIGLHSAEG